MKVTDWKTRFPAAPFSSTDRETTNHKHLIKLLSSDANRRAAAALGHIPIVLLPDGYRSSGVIGAGCFLFGLLLLVLTSATPSSARLFLSHSQDEMDAFYPPLPHDTRLAYALSKGDSADTNQVLITWKAAERVRFVQ
ncbi:unnamed protein product [Heligmosomoides polygyrus]|uniref:SSD domain-containing protein n=1 Tax=Heligmosomoides polygyrus TaxID=6339 RepID=A0A183G9I7_HELPZ|nr:unnamed protein product [Heligmosomoides polygyrus]